ncbi:LOW QUALITY PROTEIN: hypothetical protein, conserved [Eimeria necatrix]|uniref:Uncharacterized protein n=1 Tax=Eimeria necatrix TaxID=51315 RepID=U6MYL8_9EIME|nr:LOW QUALITY PROTEIN: hypothetical protein, conserved [Eimeria necatrix]CDJ69347.1 hypothetical protein, conserved [Eimeria necatrix]
MNGSDGLAAAPTAAAAAAAAAARDNASWLLRAARRSASAAAGIHSPCSVQPCTDIKTKVGDTQLAASAAAADASKIITTSRPSASLESCNDKGGLLQELSIALFSKLAESLPKDRGPLSFMSWEDGSWYCGQMADGALDGVGVYRYTDNSVYCGQWSRDRLHGFGVFITPSGFVYKGSFEADKQNGPGWHLFVSLFAFCLCFEYVLRCRLLTNMTVLLRDLRLVLDIKKRCSGTQHIGSLLGSHAFLVYSGIFLVPQGPTFFGHFREGRLHGFSCCVSPSGASRPLLGEWRDGEFLRALPLHSRIADFYIRAAEALDLLEAPWGPLPVPMPDATLLGLPKEEVPGILGSTGAPSHARREPKLCSAAMLEALRIELPRSLLQVAAAEGARHAAQQQQQQNGRHSSGRLACSGKSLVRKRKASNMPKVQSKDGNDAAGSRVKGPGGDGYMSGGNTTAPPRATTTKAQLLRWESEARKLPRIPHLNYNRVLGRWYARVRDPTSGRRIWKGYTCAVHGFFQARDMAIDRLRQFSQLVAPLPTAAAPHESTNEAGGGTEVHSTETSGDGKEQQQQQEHDHQSVPSQQAESEIAVDGTVVSTAPSAKGNVDVKEAQRQLGLVPNGAVCGAMATAECNSSANSPAVTPTTADTARKESPRSEANNQDGPEVALLNARQRSPADLKTHASCSTADEAAAATVAAATTASPLPPQQQQQQLPAITPSGLSFGTEAEAAEHSCLQHKDSMQDEEGVSCSRLTTADCSDTLISRCTPTHCDSA